MIREPPLGLLREHPLPEQQLIDMLRREKREAQKHQTRGMVALAVAALTMMVALGFSVTAGSLGVLVIGGLVGLLCGFGGALTVVAGSLRGRSLSREIAQLERDRIPEARLLKR